MALLGKLFGRKPFGELRKEAEGLRDAGELGRAKLAFERAADARDASDADRKAMRAAADGCCDRIAEARLGEAERLYASGQQDLAQSELDHALETAAAKELRTRIRAAMERMQQQELQVQLDGASTPELDDDARYETLGGNWDMAQHAEYAAYGEPFKRALLALHDGRATQAQADLEALIDRASAPQYLWFELARARLAAGDDAGAASALHTFLTELEPDETGDARLSAYMTLAALRNEANDVEGALAHYQDALEAMPEDPRTYLAMGSLLRQQGLSEEAIDILHSGLAVLDEGQSHFRLWLECGLAHAAADQPAQAIHWLEQVVEYFATRQHFDLPAEGTRCLAELHERSGNLARAADLFRMLSDGSDADNLLHYHREAARLLLSLDQREDARRMLVRARELVPLDDTPTRAALDAQIRDLA